MFRILYLEDSHNDVLLLKRALAQTDLKAEVYLTAACLGSAACKHGKVRLFISNSQVMQDPERLPVSGSQLTEVGRARTLLA